ncbi:MAG TPA: magnesium transporter [Longimicrobium sp.]
MAEAPDDRSAVERIRDLLEGGDAPALTDALTGLHPSDLADLLEALDDDERTAVLRALASEPALAAEALAEMEPDEHPEESLAALGSEQMGDILAELAVDDAADIIGEMDPEDQVRALASLPRAEAGEIRELMRYHEESAGGIMTTELVAVPVSLTAAETIAEVRRQAQEVGEFYVIFVVDADGRLAGWLPLPSLVTAEPDARVADLVQPTIATVLPETDQEEVGRLVARYNLTVVPVVDAEGHLLGGVTFDDVIDIIEAESTEDLLRFGGTSGEEELRGGWWDAIRARLPWLFVNLFTAFAAALVVIAFQSTVAALPLLAVLMPVIAGMGGNTGTQALAVTVRRLALTRESPGNRWSVVGKELLVGMGNGFAIGTIVAIAAFVTYQNAMLGVVVLVAMWMNLAVAGFAGAFVPIVLERLNVDPAVASSIFVTTFTDTCGFLLLLGLASQLLL